MLVPVQRLLILCGRPAGVLGADPAMAAVTVVLSWHVGEQEDAVSAWFIEPMSLRTPESGTRLVRLSCMRCLISRISSPPLSLRSA